MQRYLNVDNGPEIEMLQAAKILIQMKSPSEEATKSQLSILISPPESLDLENKTIKMDGFNWLLVEYIGDETTLCPKYSIIHINRVVNRADIYVGKVVLVHSKYSSSACRVQIIRMADDKRHLKMYKLYLERQDKQVRNILAVCMRTIKGIRQDPTTEFGIPVKPAEEAVAGPSSMKGTAVPAIVADFDTDSESSDLESEDSSSPISPEDLEGGNKIKNSQPAANANGWPNKKRSTNGHPTRAVHSSTPETIKKETADKSVQTDEWRPIQKDLLERLEETVTQLYRKYLVLEACVQNSNNQETETRDRGVSAERATSAESNGLQEPVPAADRERHSDDGDAKVNGHGSDAGPMTVRKAAAHTTNVNTEANDDMVEIGNGCAKIPIRVWRNIQWECYSSATRQMLNAIFPRKILATHSLSGKQSPAFSDRPAKKQLDPKIIEDIVNTVSEHCQVPKNMVRCVITTKCTDEARLYQNRQEARRQLKTNRVTTRAGKGNVSPTSRHTSSRESSNGTD